MSDHLKALGLRAKYDDLMVRNGIDTDLRRAYFFSSIAFDSQFKMNGEVLNLSANHLRRDYFHLFPNDTLARIFERNPEKIANRIYANKFGNGDNETGDGHKFRGRGFIYVRGRRDYEKLTKSTRIPYLTNPELITKEIDCMIVSVWLWHSKRLNRYADSDNVRGLSKIMGDKNNRYQERNRLVGEYKNVFN